MPWTAIGVRKRLQVFGVLGILGGLMLASIHMAAAQDTTEEPVTRVTGDYVAGEELQFDIPSSFFPGFAVGGSIEVQSRSLMRGGEQIPSATIVVERVRLEEDQTDSDLIAPNPDKPGDTVVDYLGRTIRISVLDGSDDITDEITFNPTITASFEITDAEWALANNDPGVFVVRVWDTQRDMWLVLETQTNPFDRIAAAKAGRGGDFAVFRELPPPPDGGDFALSSSALALILLGGLMLVGVGVVLVRSSSASRAR